MVCTIDPLNNLSKNKQITLNNSINSRHCEHSEENGKQKKHFEHEDVLIDTLNTLRKTSGLL